MRRFGEERRRKKRERRRGMYIMYRYKGGGVKGKAKWKRNLMMGMRIGMGRVQEWVMPNGIA